MKCMAVLTSGGDAPGMNAAIRSAVHVGIDKGWEIMGIRHGYAGLITNNVIPLGARDVSGIIQQGGTMLGSARCPEFKTEDGRLQALHVLAEHKIEAMVIIGGGGSQTGAHALSQMGSAWPRPLTMTYTDQILPLEWIRLSTSPWKRSTDSRLPPYLTNAPF